MLDRWRVSGRFRLAQTPPSTVRHHRSTSESTAIGRLCRPHSSSLGARRLPEPRTIGFSHHARTSSAAGQFFHMVSGFHQLVGFCLRCFRYRDRRFSGNEASAGDNPRTWTLSRKLDHLPSFSPGGGEGMGVTKVNLSNGFFRIISSWTFKCWFLSVLSTRTADCETIRPFAFCSADLL